MFWIIALFALAYNAWMAWQLYDSLKMARADDWSDWSSSIWVAAGSLASIVTAIRVLV